MTHSDELQRETVRLAVNLGRDLKAMRAAVGVKSKERAVLVRSLHQVFGMTHREIADKLGISGPRVSEIIHGPRKRNQGQGP